MLPFGGPQFAEGRHRKGLAFGTAQLAAGALTTTFLIRMRQLGASGDIDAELRWRMVSAGATATTAGFWFGSTLEASRYRQLRQEELAAAGRAWQLARLTL